ncbi:hypothetical protein VZH09_13880 (plasmid) [Synechococcus elongatus IITB7]|uniref:hypothetical protein n=1 Tax=Synechococcus elongatus TaxID=32046 RepID=UPI0030CC55C3
MGTVAGFLLALPAEARPPEQSCQLSRSIYRDVNGKGFELSFKGGRFESVSQWAIATLRHRQKGVKTAFDVSSMQGAGGIILTPRGNKYRESKNDLNLYVFNANLTSSVERGAPTYIFISGLGSFDWYWNRDQGEPYVWDTLWKFNRCS